MIKLQVFLETVSEKRCGKDFGLVYNPEFIALGRIISDFLNPDMVLIGASDVKAGVLVEEIHRKLVNNHPDIHTMNFYNAELAKIALNAYCVMKINFANTLAEICERMPGGNAQVITKAIGSDRRIGYKYFSPGLSVAGPCFPRDSRAFFQSASRYDVYARIAEAADITNTYNKERIAKRIAEILENKKLNRVAILGLSYKEDTSVIEESNAVYIAKYLIAQGHFISVYDPDPIAMSSAIKEIDNENAFEYASVVDCLRGTQLCFIATPWETFKHIPRETFIKNMKCPIIFDAWDLITDDQDLEIYRIGLA